MLVFADNTKVSLKGLGEIMAALYAEGRRATYETADEIIKRLEERNNFIPSSETARREYLVALLREYHAWGEERSGR
jgi:hypothetical protein